RRSATCRADDRGQIRVTWQSARRTRDRPPRVSAAPRDRPWAAGRPLLIASAAAAGAWTGASPSPPMDAYHQAPVGRSGPAMMSPTVAEGQLLIGAMAWSGKTADLRRDPRYVLHSAVTDPDSGEGELKLSGAAVEASHHRNGAVEAWWSAWPPDKAVVFCLGI